MARAGAGAGPGPDVLVAAARSGDPAAWRELYARHQPRLRLWLQSLPHPDAASSADDVASEAWLTAASKLGEFGGSDEEFAPWLFTIARHHAGNASRKAVRRRTDPVDDAGHDGSTAPQVSGDIAPEVVRDLDSQAATRTLLGHLSPREAEVVACVDVVGLDVAATAEVLGMKPTAVRVARHRALGRLRGVLERRVADQAVEPATPSAVD